VAFRVTTVHVVVAVLLTCPFICLAQAAGLSTSTACDPSGCGCCPKSASGGGKECPGKPDPYQGSGTCLCHGAVMDRHVVAPDPGHEFVGFVPLDTGLLAQGPVADEGGLTTQRASCHFPSADSGRAVRALIVSLLL
jgi:hypothetical protein